MTPDPAAEWRTRLLWAFLGVTVAGIYNLGTLLKTTERLTVRTFIGDALLQVVNAVVAVKLALVAGWGVQDTAYLALGIGIVGQKTAVQLLRQVAMRYLGITPEQMALPSSPSPAADPVSPAPSASGAHLVDPRAVPIAQLGSRWGAQNWPRSGAKDPDRDLLDKLDNEETGQ